MYWKNKNIIEKKNKTGIYGQTEFRTETFQLLKRKILQFLNLCFWLKKFTGTKIDSDEQRI